MTLDRETMEAALVGLTTMRNEIEQKIAEIRKLLGHRAGRSVTPSGAAPKPRKTMGAAARKRIAAAQKKRWAAFHAERASVAKTTPPKRKLSPERRAALAANLAKARAALTTHTQPQ